MRPKQVSREQITTIQGVCAARDSMKSICQNTPDQEHLRTNPSKNGIIYDLELRLLPARYERNPPRTQVKVLLPSWR